MSWKPSGPDGDRRTRQPVFGVCPIQSGESGKRSCRKPAASPFASREKRDLVLFSRALPKLAPEAAELIATRIAAAEPNSALEHAILWTKAFPHFVSEPH